jgi:hypothetical protein
VQKDAAAMNETFAICGCPLLHKKNTYARATKEGRSHRTKHHYVPERFFGRSVNRKGTKRLGIFETCPWQMERETGLFCYECHEELLHNPVLLPGDVTKFAALVRCGRLSEKSKSNDRKKIAGRIRLFQKVIQLGIVTMYRKKLANKRKSVS